MKRAKVAILLFGITATFTLSATLLAQKEQGGKVVDLTWEFVRNETYDDIEYDSTTHQHVFRPHFRERLSALNGEQVSITGYLSMIHDTVDFWVVCRDKKNEMSGNYRKELSMYLKPPVLLTEKDEGRLVNVVGRLELAGVNPHQIPYTLEEARIRE